LFEFPIWNFDDNANGPFKNQVKVGQSLALVDKLVAWHKGFLLGNPGEVIDSFTGETSEERVATEHFY
jgi:hypothetical protein